MMTTPLPRRELRLALLLLPFLAACRGEPAPAPAPLTAEQKDHKELSRQPSQEWTPSNTPRKLNILFLLDKNRIRKGETFRYRLEMQNLGQEPLAFKEAAPSFIKDGSLCGSGDIKLYAAPPDGKETLCTKLDILKEFDNKTGKDLFKLLPVFREDCKNCGALFVCGGGCFWDAFFNKDKKDKKTCYFTKHLVKSILWDMHKNCPKNKLIATVGIRDFVVILADDALLVCPKDRAGEVKNIVEELRKKGLKKYL